VKEWGVSHTISVKKYPKQKGEASLMALFVDNCIKRRFIVIDPSVPPSSPPYSFQD